MHTRTSLLAATASLLGLGATFGHTPWSNTFGRYRRGGHGSYTPPMTPKARPNRARLRRQRRISAATSRCRPFSR